MFGISRSVRSREVQVCTPELFHRAIKGSKVSLICAEIEDALEKLRRGELKKEEYERMKTQLKSQLPILTPHATFKNGRRLNADAIPSGLSIYDKDHIPNPRGYWEEKQKILAQKSVLDSICLVHVTPSTEGLRLIFKIPKGMTLAEAQKWMSEQLEDNDYDSCVKDLARPSFLVPEDYILYIDEAKLFEVANTSLNIKEGGASESEDIKEGSASESEDLKQGGLHRTNNRNSVASNNKGEGFDAPPTLERSGSERRVGAVSPSPLRGEGRGERWSPPYEGGTGWLEKTSETQFPQEYNGIPYATLVTKLVELLGGEPQHGSRNTFIFTLACYLRYICDDNADWVKSVIPIFGEEQRRAFTTVALLALASKAT